jgi:hypothetical protein
MPGPCHLALRAAIALAVLTSSGLAGAAPRPPRMTPAPAFGAASPLTPVVVMFNFAIIRHRALDTLFELVDALPDGEQRSVTSLPADADRVAYPDREQVRRGPE